MSDSVDRPVMSEEERVDDLERRMRHALDVNAVVDEELAKTGGLPSVSFLDGDEVTVEYGDPGVTVTDRVEVVLDGQTVEVTLERNGKVGTLMVSTFVGDTGREGRSPSVFASVQSPSLRSGDPS